jgi:hypothetical protein
MTDILGTFPRGFHPTGVQVWVLACSPLLASGSPLVKANSKPDGKQRAGNDDPVAPQTRATGERTANGHTVTASYQLGTSLSALILRACNGTRGGAAAAGNAESSEPRQCSGGFRTETAFQ